LDLKQNLRDKGKLVEQTETQELREKLAKYETSLANQDRDNANLKKQLKEKE
jgi:hypothetical protein